MNIEYVYGVDLNSGYVKASEANINFLRSLGHIVKPFQGFQYHKPDIRFLHVAAYAFDHTLLDRSVPTMYIYDWELPMLPYLFKSFAGQFDYCLTSSEYQAEIYKKETGRSNIDWIPHLPMYTPTAVKKTKNTPFTFLSVNRWDRRKDFETLARAFSEEFDYSEPVRLELKITHSDIKTVLETLGKYSRCSNIDYLFYNFSEPEMQELYRQADVFVTATRGEGWGYGYQEALLNGVPCIYPKLPSVVDSFFDCSNSISVLSRYVPVDPMWEAHNYLDARQFMWGQTNVADLRAAMRTAYEYYPFTLPVSPAPSYYRDQDRIKGVFERLIAEFCK
jgi:glycosyltransferase involved in cell wall biosynthesis